VPTGAARDIEFIADAEGDWAFHCHKVHHLMNGMGHNLPLNLGVQQDDLAARLAKRIPGYMPMPASMSGMMEMGRPRNSFDEIDAGGMFTVVKVRKTLASYDDPGWYQHPEGTVAEPA
jgi:manganese oxidase